ncbi:MAG: cardiolipin synthase, partial [Proteobacteria bacterium]|nr:cardiolipin synthase [Pseudomonadota bacterium]
VLEFNPVNPLAGNKKAWLLNNRDHRKLLVVDGRIAFIGGINISESYSSGPSMRSARKKEAKTVGWRDTHLQIEGPVVAEFQKLFMDTWSKQKGPPLAGRNYFPKLDRQGDEIVRAIGSASDDPHSLIYLTLLSAITSAEQRVYLTNAYFVPDPQLLKSLTDAAQRNVEVKLVLPSHTDSWAVFHAGRSHYSELLRAGVRIYERRGAVMHSKTATDRHHRRRLVDHRLDQSGLAQLPAQRRNQCGDSRPRFCRANGSHVCPGSGGVRCHRCRSLGAPFAVAPIERVGGAARRILAIAVPAAPLSALLGGHSPNGALLFYFFYPSIVNRRSVGKSGLAL